MMRPSGYRSRITERAESALGFAVRVWIAAAMLLAPAIAFLGGAVWCAFVLGWMIRIAVVMTRSVLP